MAKDPALLFYPADFIIGTSFFSMSERGQYILILCHMHQVGGHMDIQEIKAVCPDVTEKVMKKFMKGLDGRYYNERLLTEIEKRQRFTKSRIKNLMGSHTDSHMEAHMENENENRNVIKKDDSRFVPPTIDEVRAYFSEKGYPAVEADKFWHRNEAGGWKVGKNRMQKWKSAAATWMLNVKEWSKDKQTTRREATVRKLQQVRYE